LGARVRRGRRKRGGCRTRTMLGGACSFSFSEREEAVQTRARACGVIYRNVPVPSRPTCRSTRCAPCAENAGAQVGLSTTMYGPAPSGLSELAHKIFGGLSSIGPRTTPMARVAPTRLHSPAHLGRASRGRSGAQLARRGVPVRARAGDDTAGESTSTSTSRFSFTPGSAPPSSALGRREALGSVAALTAGLVCLTPPDARALVEEVASARPKVPDYTARGSYGVKRLPKLEHTCVSCFPRCVGDACLLSIDAYVPTPPAVLPDAMFPVRGGKVAPDGDGDGDKLRDRSRGPYPLAVFTSGTAFPNHHVPPA
jgi:hypothetical protein